MIHITKTELIYAALCALTVRLENEYIQLRNNVWYRNPSSYDLYEQIVAWERLRMMHELTETILYILCGGYPDDLTLP